jgi:hypothetical protein
VQLVQYLKFFKINVRGSSRIRIEIDGEEASGRISIRA